MNYQEGRSKYPKKKEEKENEREREKTTNANKEKRKRRFICWEKRGKLEGEPLKKVSNRKPPNSTFLKLATPN